MSLLEYKLDLIAEALGAYTIKTVTAVIRRQHTNPEDGTVTDVIDFYPAWNEWGSYGKHKVAHEYLDKEWQRDRFERFSGLRVDDLPIYGGQQALIRRFGVTHEAETAVVKPFDLMLQPRQGEDGKLEKTLILRYIAKMGSNGRTQVSSPSLPEPKPETTSNGRQATPPPVGETDWRKEAVGANDALMFDSAICRHLTWFQTSDLAEQFRVALWPEFSGQHTAAYVAGLEAYVAYRKKAGQGRTVHKNAKAEAYKAFEAAVRPASTPNTSDTGARPNWNAPTTAVGQRAVGQHIVATSYQIGDEVMVHGELEERLGVVVGFVDDLFIVSIGGRDFKLTASRLSLVSDEEE